MDYVRIVRLSLQMLLSGAAGVNDLSGPVGIVSTITEVGKETEATEGFGAALENILFFAAMFAVNLAVMNLLPLPALDGGHVLFLLVNGIAVALFKKEIPSKYLNVINGIGRLQVAAEAKRPVVRCVVVTKEQEAFATAMLNLLSMDFDIASYADDLRYNSFMRERNTRETDAEGNAALGDGFFKGVFPKNRGRDFCKLEGAALEAWRRHYGSSVVDFGAGKLNNTRTLRKAGIHVAAFEPYFVTVGENIHKAKSVEIAEKFLDDVEAGTPFTSVFISSVFNSVPFMADRKQIAVIAAALCSPGGRTVCWCQSNKAPQCVNTKKKVLAAEKTLTFDLDYEPNTILGDIGNHPKAQKGHTEEEMREIFAPCFRKVDRLEMIQKFWYMEVSEPIVDPEALGAALDFEFELPYPDGTRMGLSERARKAFEHRLGISIPRKEST